MSAPVYHLLLALPLLVQTLLAQPLRVVDIPPSANKTFLVVLSHHDDHTWEWGFGGFIAKLADAGWTGYYVRTTNDEKDSGTNWGKGDQINLKESRDAARHLGLRDVISLNWRNDHMDSIPIQELRAHYILLIRKFRPDIVLTWNPWAHYDRNPDHRKVGRAMGEALWMAGLGNVHPEHSGLGLKPWRVPNMFFTGRADYGRGHTPNVAVSFSEAQLRRKQAAFWAHQNVYGNPAAGRALRESLAARNLQIPEMEGLSDLQATEWMNKQHMEWVSRHDGSQVGVAFAERFFFRDEWDHLPGLKEYLQKEASSR